MVMPPVPEKPFLTGNVTDTSITIAWKVQNNSDITHYMVSIRRIDERTGETSCWESCRTRNTSKEYQFTSLKPDTTYQFRVSSCAGGTQCRPSGISDSIKTCPQGKKSQSNAAPTKELHTMINIGPSRAPQKPTLNGKPEHNRVPLAWDVQGDTSKVTHYIVKYKAVENGVADLDFVGSWAKYETKDAQKSCIIDRLEPLTSYRFCVSSVTEKGLSPPSPISSVISTTEDPTSVPVIVRLTVDGPVTYNSVPLTWEVAGNIKRIVNYSVTARKKADGKGKIKTYQTTQTKYTILGLDPLTCYQFHVWPNTRLGCGVQSEMCEITTEKRPHRSSDQWKNTAVMQVPAWHGTYQGGFDEHCYSSSQRSEITSSRHTGFSSHGQVLYPLKPELAGEPSSDSIPVTWRIIGDRYRVHHYTLSCQRADGTGPLMTYYIDNTSYTDDDASTFYIAEGLHAGTSYIFYVTLFTEKGQSLASEESDVFTTCRSLENRNNSEDMLSLVLKPNMGGSVSHNTWKDTRGTVVEKAIPLPQEPILSGEVGQFSVPLCWKVEGDTSHIMHYTLTYRKTSCKSPWMIFETSAADRQCTVEGLDLETTYKFRVAANTDRGQSLPSKESEAITTAAAPESKTEEVLPPRPLKPNVRGAVTPESVLLTWRVEGNTNEVTHYTVAYMGIGKQKKNKWITIETDDSEKHLTVVDLDPGTAYIFRVSSNTRRGQSLPSENSDVVVTPEEHSGISPKDDGKTPVQTPPKPKLGGTPSHSSIPLVWEARDNMDVTHFTLSYRKTDGPKGIWVCVETQDPGPQFTVTDLDPDSSYEFRVAANTKVGQTRPSDVSETIRTQPNSKILMNQKSPKPCKLVQVGPQMHDSLTLGWTVDGDTSEVTHYTLSYRAVETKADTCLQGAECLIDTENAEYQWITIKDLNPLTTYQCMIMANTKDGQICKTDSAEVFTTAADPEMKTTSQNQPSSDHSEVPAACPIPSKPRLAPDSQPTQTTLPIVWEVDMEGSDITHFTLLHKAVDEDDWKEVEIPDVTCEYTLQGLQPGQAYSVRLKSHTPNDSSDGGPVGGPFETEKRTERQIYHDELISKSELAKSDKDMPIYQVPLQLVEKNEAERIQKFDFNTKAAIHEEEKVILVVGATGAGKSTLINGLLNYILGVEWSDEVRFRLVEESGLFEDQHQSQTRAVTVYTLHHHSVFTVPYTVTIIDTPGFGDTQGIDKDRLISQSITHLFSKKEYGIDHIDAIGFVAQSSLARLTQTQMYIFDSILSLFGNDIGENIFLLITFSDSQKPPVLASTKEANIPFQSYFKFNNSALFARNDTEDDEFDLMFWKMGAISFKKFLRELEAAVGKSLYLTKQVLDERQQLEVYVTGIQIEIRNGLTKLEQYRVEANVVKQHEADIERNRDFKYTVDEMKMKQVDLQPGQHVTNCMTCNRTCHYLCAYANDEDKKHCVAMGPNGFCKICPNNCIWNLHRNVPYRIEIETVQVTKTADDLKKRYEKAKGEKMNAEKLTNEILEDFYNLELNVAYMATEVRRGLVRLSEIALKPNPLSTVQYLELMINSEKVEGKPGFEARIKQLEGVKAQATILNEMAVDGYDPFDEYRETLRQAKDAKDRPSFQYIAEDIKKKNPSGAKKFFKAVKGMFHF